MKVKINKIEIKKQSKHNVTVIIIDKQGTYEKQLIN